MAATAIVTTTMIIDGRHVQIFMNADESSRKKKPALGETQFSLTLGSNKSCVLWWLESTKLFYLSHLGKFNKGARAHDVHRFNLIHRILPDHYVPMFQPGCFRLACHGSAWGAAN